MNKNYCTSLRGKTFRAEPDTVAAHWFDKGNPHRIDGKLPAGQWVVDSIGECGPGGEFLVVYRYSPFMLAYVYLPVGMPLVS